MGIRKENIVINRGATFRKKVALKDAAGAARNLTGYTAKLQIRRDLDDVATLISLTSGDGLTINGPLGEIEIEIAKVLTAALSVRSGVYDLFIDNGQPDGGEYVMMGGVIIQTMVTQ